MGGCDLWALKTRPRRPPLFHMREIAGDVSRDLVMVLNGFRCLGARLEVNGKATRERYDATRPGVDVKFTPTERGAAMDKEKVR